MTVEKVLEQLLEIERFNRKQIDKLYRMDKEDGKKMYGSVKSYNEAKSIWLGKTMQIEDLINYIKYQLQIKKSYDDLYKEVYTFLVDFIISLFDCYNSFPNNPYLLSWIKRYNKIETPYKLIKNYEYNKSKNLS